MSTSGAFAYSGTAASNTTIGGVSVAESCDMANLNNGIRALAADTYNGIIARGTDLASAATLDLDGASTPSLTHNVTGTTTTTAITLTAGHWRILRAAAAWPLTASSSLIINGSDTQSYTCAADDILLVEGFTSSVVRVWVISNGIRLGTATATTSGTSKDFTSIPAWAKQITINFDGVSVSGTSTPLIQLGDSGGIEATGYKAAASGLSSVASTAAYTTGFGTASNIAANLLYGSVTFTLVDASTFTWAASGVVYGDASGSPFTATISGTKSLSAALDRVRITTVNGTDTFDAGKVNIAYA